MPDAAYYRAWRAAHPDYRERQNVLRRARRVRMTPEQRRRDRGIRRTPVYEGLLPIWSGDHPLIVAARAIVGRGQHGQNVSFIEDEQALDAIGICVLAMLEGRDPRRAVAKWYERERRWVNATRGFGLGSHVADRLW